MKCSKLLQTKFFADFYKKFCIISNIIVMKKYIYIIEKCAETDVYVGYIPGFAGAHSQAETLDELSENMREVVEMLLEDGEPKMETDFVGTQYLLVA